MPSGDVCHLKRKYTEEQGKCKQENTHEQPHPQIQASLRSAHRRRDKRRQPLLLQWASELPAVIAFRAALRIAGKLVAGKLILITVLPELLHDGHLA